MVYSAESNDLGMIADPGMTPARTQQDKALVDVEGRTVVVQQLVEASAGDVLKDYLQKLADAFGYLPILHTCGYLRTLADS